MSKKIIKLWNFIPDYLPLTPEKIDCLDESNFSTSHIMDLKSRDDKIEFLWPHYFLWKDGKSFLTFKTTYKIKTKFLDFLFNKDKIKDYFELKKFILYSQTTAKDETAFFQISHKSEDDSQTENIGFLKIIYIDRDKNSIKYFYREEISDITGERIEATEDGSIQYIYLSFAVTASKDAKNLIDKFEKLLSEYEFSENSSKFKIFTKDSYDGFKFKDVSLKIPQNSDIALNYGEDFVPIHEKIVKSLNEKDQGLYLFRGVPGTGKSTYVKILSEHFNKKILYIPPSFVSELEKPDFQEFLENEKNSIIFIEDAEKIVKSRESDSSSSVLNVLLNFTDGWLAETYKISFILTLNCDMDFVDKALTRKGRLMVDYYFKELSISESQKLIDYLKIDHKVDKPMALTDIYNLQEDNNYKIKDKPVIGF